MFDICIPPLRERPADIVPLCEMFLQEIGTSFGRPPAGLTTDAREALLSHDLGLSRTQLYGRLRQYGVEGPPPVQN